MKKINLLLAALLLIHAVYAQVTYLSKLDMHQVLQERSIPKANLSDGGHPITLCGKVYEKGIGTIAPSKMMIGFWKAEKFQATVGVDDEVVRGKGKLVFKILDKNNNLLWQSKELKSGDEPQTVEIDLKGRDKLILITEGDLNDTNNHADWADAKVIFPQENPSLRSFPLLKEEAVILTPKEAPTPRITGPKVFGVRPGHPFIFSVTATGERPMTFSAAGLPQGLKIDAVTGLISGKLKNKADYKVQLKVINKKGTATREFTIKCGETIGLVPAMGWNSWNCYGDSIDEKKIKAAADGLVKTGLNNHGWVYVTTDEGWTMRPNHKNPSMQGPERDEQDRINPNPKFPDMKKLAEYIHNLGLKPGIYTSPGPFACGQYTGSYQHEDIDAKRFADWGYDYLKYDMCSYNQILSKKVNPDKDNNLTKPMDKASKEYLAELQRPWRVMRSSLDKLDRDIIYSISGNTRNWGIEVGANSWRTSSDIVDSWDEWLNGWEVSITHIGFTDKPNQAYGASHCNGPELVAPGHFNDRDMLVVGWVGWEKESHPTMLTPNEQYTHVSLWCLQASPLMLGCDLSKMDEFTLSLLTNDEVLDVNQDPLAKQAVRVFQKGDFEVWVKEMEDGSKSVGLFNRGYWGGEFTAKWSDIGLSGSQKVRDLWRQKDLGVFSDSFSTKIARHGVVLLRVWPTKK